MKRQAIRFGALAVIVAALGLLWLVKPPNAPGPVEKTPVAGSTAVAVPSPVPTAAAVPSPMPTTSSRPSANLRDRLFLPLISRLTAPAPSPTPRPVVVAPPTPAPTATLASVAVQPTATPGPAPTPRPPLADRVRPAKSRYQKLQDYPRPANDTGYGFHITASPYLPKKDVLQHHAINMMNALGARWVTVWAPDDNQVEPVKMLVDTGFEVILRYHWQGSKTHPDYVPDIREMRKYVAVGVRYIQPGNEPNLSRESHTNDPGAIARQFVRASDNIKAAGAIPLLYPMSPGGDVDHRVMLKGILDWLKANDALDALDGAGIGIHNRPHNKPLEHRDSTSFLEYEWIDDLVASYVGKSLPLFGTEAGYTLGDLVDAKFPRITAEMHRDYNLQIVTGFRDGRWRDSLFAQNFWLLGSFGYPEFMADWWLGNGTFGGRDLPAVQALQNLPKFVRKFSWDR